MPRKIKENVQFLLQKNVLFSFLSFFIAIEPIIIILDVLKSSWVGLLYFSTFVYASAIVTDCCVITTDCFVMAGDGCEIAILSRILGQQQNQLNPAESRFKNSQD